MISFTVGMIGKRVGKQFSNGATKKVEKRDFMQIARQKFI